MEVPLKAFNKTFFLTIAVMFPTIGTGQSGHTDIGLAATRTGTAGPGVLGAAKY